MNAELHEPGRACCVTGSYKHLDSADVPWAGGWGSAGASVRVRSCVLSDGEAHDLAASLYGHSMHSSHPGRRSSRGRLRRVGAHRSVGRALPIRSVAGRARYRQRGDGTARGSGPGEDAVPRRPWDAAAAVERAQRRCVVLRTARPPGGQEANRWKWRRRSDSEGWLERPVTHAPPKNSAASKRSRWSVRLLIDGALGTV